MKLQAQMFVRLVLSTQHSHGDHHCRESDVKQMHQLMVNIVILTFVAWHAYTSVTECKAVGGCCRLGR